MVDMRKALRTAFALACLGLAGLVAPTPLAGAPTLTGPRADAVFRRVIGKNAEARSRVASVQYRLRESRSDEGTVTRSGEVISSLGNVFSDLLVTTQMAGMARPQKQRVVYQSNPDYKAETTYVPTADGTFRPSACVMSRGAAWNDAAAATPDLTSCAFEVLPGRSLADCYRPDDPAFRYEAEEDPARGLVKLRFFRNASGACQPLQEVTVSTRQGYLITESTTRYTCGKVARKWAVEPREIAKDTWFPARVTFLTFEAPKAPGQFARPLLEGIAIADNVKLLLSIPEEKFRLDSLRLPREVVPTVRQPVTARATTATDRRQAR